MILRVFIAIVLVFTDICICKYISKSIKKDDTKDYFHSKEYMDTVSEDD